MRLVARLGRDLADRVDKVHARHPLVGRQLDLARKVVQVPHQGAHDLAVARRHVGAHGVDDALREGRVEAAALAVGLGGSGTVCAVDAVGGHVVCGDDGDEAMDIGGRDEMDEVKEYYM